MNLLKRASELVGQKFNKMDEEHIKLYDCCFIGRKREWGDSNPDNRYIILGPLPELYFFVENEGLSEFFLVKIYSCDKMNIIFKGRVVGKFYNKGSCVAVRTKTLKDESVEDVVLKFFSPPNPYYEHVKMYKLIKTGFFKGLMEKPFKGLSLEFLLK